MKKLFTLGLLLQVMLLSAQNIYLAQDGSQTINDCNGFIYDSGGPDGEYSNNNVSLITLVATEGDLLSLTFNQFDLENNFDYISIYDGAAPNGTIYGPYSGSIIPNNGEPFISSSDTLTIIFYSDFTITASGFEIFFECIDFTDPPTAAMSFPSLTCNGTVAFSDVSTYFPNNWEWNFGDGNTSTEQNPIHSYQEPGLYDISLIVCNENGCDTTSATQAINFDPDALACTNGFNMTYQGIDSTSLCNGVLYDNGGPLGDYEEGSYDQFIIAPPGATSITLTFSAFDLGSTSNNHDNLYIYNLENQFYELLGNYSGTDLPNNGQPLTFNTSRLGIIFSSDHFSNFPGFEIIWEADGIANEPIADFTVDETVVPFGTNIQFLDQSTENPGAWNWDFGDGSTSTLQNPTHIYENPGTYEVNLTVFNCNGSSEATPITITVQEPPSITVNPDSFYVELDAGTLSTDILEICNVGNGDLIFDFQVISSNPNSGYKIEFTTSEDVEGFSWQLLDINFTVVAENQQDYEPNQTYTEIIDNLESDFEYYFIINAPDNLDPIENFILTDLGTNTLIYDGDYNFFNNLLYIFPPPVSGTEGAIDWLSIDAGTGLLSADDCQNYTVTFDATDLIGGTYEGQIIINTNDPENPVLIVPVTLVVTGTPEISVSTENLDFGEVQIGATKTLELTIENTGTDVLEISGLVSNNPVFEMSIEGDQTIAPNGILNIEVTFIPDAVTSYSENLSLQNNAGSDVPVTFIGTGIAAPSVTVDPTEFVIELIEGQDTSLLVNIGNIGEADLIYNVLPFNNNLGFIFNFTTDFWASEFSWNVLDSNNEVVLSSPGALYSPLTNYTENLYGLSSNESYTLQLLDSFGDGSLTDYLITDAFSGAIIAEGAFDEFLPELLIPLGSPSTNFADITPTEGVLAPGVTEEMNIYVDATGLATGTYFLTFDIETNDPLQPVVQVHVTLYVVAPVTADFSASPEFVCGDIPVQFTDESTNVPTSWEWDFGDGTTSDIANPSHTYNESGFYTVTLTACNSLGCNTITKTNYIQVDLDCYTQNIPLHSEETITVCDGNIYDSGGPNGNYIEGNWGILTIAPPGATSISITFDEFNYEEHSDFIYIYDGPYLTGTLIGTYTGTSLAGQTITVNSGILTIAESTDHFINLSGFAASFSCNSNPKPPTALFSVSDSLVCANEAFAFIDESINFPQEWFWNFGDGTTSNEQNPLHVYDSSGVYEVSLTACNDFGCDTEIQTITVEIDPDCLLNQIPINGNQSVFACFGELFDSGGPEANYPNNNNGLFTINSTGGPITLEFTVFDYEVFDGIIIYDGPDINSPIIGFFNGTELPLGGTVVSTGNAITIAEYSDFSITREGFELTYSCSGAALVSTQILVDNPEICDGWLSFSSKSDMDIDSWSWDFGDGQISNESDPSHLFPHNGIYDVQLITCHQNGCDTTLVSVYSNRLIPEIQAPDTVSIGEEVHVHGLTEEATHWNWDFGNGSTSDLHAPSTVYENAGWHDIHVHLINMDVHSTCDANHTHSLFVKDTATNIEEVDQKQVKIFPNPSSSFVNIDLDGMIEQEVSIRLLSTSGKVLIDQQFQPQLDISAYPPGMYILELSTESELIDRRKVVKQ